jgi:hypothetical protein
MTVLLFTFMLGVITPTLFLQCQNRWGRGSPARDRRGVLHDFRRTGSAIMHEQLGNLPHIVERTLVHIGHQSDVAGKYIESSLHHREASRVGSLG